MYEVSPTKLMAFASYRLPTVLPPAGELAIWVLGPVGAGGVYNPWWGFTGPFTSIVHGSVG